MLTKLAKLAKRAILAKLAMEANLAKVANLAKLSSKVSEANNAIKAKKGAKLSKIANCKGSKGRITGEQLTSMGKLAAERFAKGLLFDGGVRARVYRMPDVWAVVGADEDCEVHVAGHRTLLGTAGDWAPAVLR